MPRVTLYRKEGCHLCESVEQTVRTVQRAKPFELEVRDVEADPADLKKYKDLIPVVLVDGKEIARYRLAPFALMDALERAAERERKADANVER
jgi:glutaredoxin